jgi:hypothetical protein
MAELGFPRYWDGYFAGGAAPLGRVPAEVVDAAFCSFADGEVARHIAQVWETTTPEAAHAARQRGCVAALRRILGDLVVTPELARAAELVAQASTTAATEGRVMYAGLRSLPMPDEPLARLWHAANMLREHRGDGHVVEGYNRLARHQGCNAFGFRNVDDQRRRTRWACTRQHRRASATTSEMPGQVR